MASGIRVSVACVALGILPLIAPTASAAQLQPAATADIRDRLSRFIGTASFREEQGGVRITGILRNLAPGAHGFHIDNVAQCLSPTFLSAGTIFNPTGKKHGLRNPAGPQVGDLPSLMIGPDGTANLDVMVRGATLSNGPAALLGGNGTSLIVHVADDDQISEPEGNSGDRVACGVILPSDPVAASATAQSRGPAPATVAAQPGVAAPVAAPATAQQPPANTAQRSGSDQGGLGSPLIAGALGVLLVAAGYFLRRQSRRQ